MTPMMIVEFAQAALLAACFIALLIVRSRLLRLARSIKLSGDASPSPQSTAATVRGAPEPAQRRASFSLRENSGEAVSPAAAEPGEAQRKAEVEPIRSRDGALIEPPRYE